MLDEAGLQAYDSICQEGRRSEACRSDIARDLASSLTVGTAIKEMVDERLADEIQKIKNGFANNEDVNQTIGSAIQNMVDEAIANEHKATEKRLRDLFNEESARREEELNEEYNRREKEFNDESARREEEFAVHEEESALRLEAKFAQLTSEVRRY